MKTACKSLVVAAFAGVLAATISGQAAAEQDISLAEVPDNVRIAAEQAVPGIKFTEADILKSRKGQRIYELEGSAEGQSYEVKVSPEGKVLKVKKEHQKK